MELTSNPARIIITLRNKMFEIKIIEKIISYTGM
jgi:hypothetical protein